MKKIDLHIHTLQTNWDVAFNFSLDKLKEYIEVQKIDCIAITNHNKFDLEQFQLIEQELIITVYPGIEISLEKGHILLLSDNDEVDDFSAKCEQIENLIQNIDDNIDISKFKEIFTVLNKYLLIPHYKKSPSIGPAKINELLDYIDAGEVSSVKKFKSCIKDATSLIPVVFSDCRLTCEDKDLPTKQTYIDLEDISFSGIKTCLNDKSKISLSIEGGNELFQVCDDLYISTGLTIILGERSSGKTYTLNKIFECNNKIKYIKQFSLLKDDEESFNKKLSTEKNKITEDYLNEFKQVVDDIVNVDVEENERTVDSYLSSLLQNASETEMADVYSKCTMYNEIKFEIKDLSNLKELISATEKLIENEEYRELIEKHIEIDQLKSLCVALIEKFYYENEILLKQHFLNSIIDDIKNALRTRSSQTNIEDLDLYKIVFDNKKIETFFNVVDLLKNQNEIYNKNIGKFKVTGEIRRFTGAQALKTKSGRQWAFTNAFAQYNQPYEYLQELKKVSYDLPTTDYYKYYVDVEYKILNDLGFEISGGERAEFNLLEEIQDAIKHDMLLIDEPESSFDNLFLKNEVNKLIKQLSDEIPVVIVTHNNTVGASIKPDYILYTKRETDGENTRYTIYSGYPSDKQLKDNDGNKIENYFVLLSCLEAGDEAYNERRVKLYDILKN